jgi:hypothetical protein
MTPIVSNSTKQSTEYKKEIGIKHHHPASQVNMQPQFSLSLKANNNEADEGESQTRTGNI